MTKDEKTLEQIKLAVAGLKVSPPPADISEAKAIKEYYAIFDGPVRWKAGIRTPEEVGSSKTTGFGFKTRPRREPAAVS